MEPENGEKRAARYLFVVDYLYTPNRCIENGAVLCEGEKIIAIGGVSGFLLEDQRIEVIKLPDCYLTPGFIDTHIHGAGGCDCSRVRESIRPLEAMSSLLTERGVTGFFPTVVADAPEKMIQNLSFLAEELQKQMSGAAALGINVEGPFINVAKRGAQDAASICPIDLGFARELIDAGRGRIKVMTLAPELPDAVALIELLKENNIISSMGHSMANEEEAVRAIDAGATHCTHLFNGMQPLHQREVGLAAVALTDPRVTIELSIDGRHVNPRMVDLACRCKAADQIIGISDCTMAAGMPDGEYHIGPSGIRVQNGYSMTGNSVLAGTTTMLDFGWHCLMSSGHLSEGQAVPAVTANPAAAYDLTELGVLRPGNRADLAVFELKTNRPMLTVCGGKIVYRAEK